jgi:MFS transporter, UMF1 family
VEKEDALSFETKRQPGWKLYVSLPILSRALYDFANTIFSSNINTFFSRFMFRKRWEKARA